MGPVQSSILTHNMPGHIMVWYRERGRRRWRGGRRIGVGSGEEEVAREERKGGGDGEEDDEMAVTMERSGGSREKEEMMVAKEEEEEITKGWGGRCWTEGRSIAWERMHRLGFGIKVLSFFLLF